MKRIVHLGVGNFHRAHQAWYTVPCTDWKISGVIMSNKTLFDRLARNANAYLLGIWGAQGLHRNVIDVHDEMVLATEGPDRVTDLLSDPDTHVVTLTITEKGYFLRAADHRLDLQAPAINADLSGRHPKTAIGLLGDGLIKRSSRGEVPITIISCDNLAGNGDKLQGAIHDYIRAKNPEALRWIKRSVTFPNTMVDRITPRLSDASIIEITTDRDEPDLSVVGTEAFTEWVIEDKFAGPRPGWDQRGALFVKNVAPFEERKLRLLNAAHSYLAYAGQLAGYRYVHEAIADPELRQGIEMLWDEASITISPPASDNIGTYRQALVDRFAVPALRHELSQIAADGSLKLLERLVPVYRLRKKRGLASPGVETAMLAWADYVIAACHGDLVLNDPQATAFRDLCRDGAVTAWEVLNFIGIEKHRLE